MLKDAISRKRCLMVCGGGGVGKTTIAASIAIAAARVRPRVLVVTIDPAKRLLQAFGYSDALLQKGGEPLKLSTEVLRTLDLPETASLSVAVLNPAWVLDQIVSQSVPESKRKLLQNTVIYKEMGQMIHGLQEYTAYEWVTRMIANNEYDLIVLDTPPAFHAKEFFNAPEKIRNLMESRVFSIFLPGKSTGWFKAVLSFGWMEKLLGERLYRESTLFFETFLSLRERIIGRCNQLAEFFKQQDVSVVTVGTTESTPLIEIEGLIRFLEAKGIPLEAIVINQVEEAAQSWSDEGLELLSVELREKLQKLKQHQNAKADRAEESLSHIRKNYPRNEIHRVPMVYSDDGFEILRNNSKAFN
jgi:anion-transporting  ArsA/GET3 family ATPase